MTLDDQQLDELLRDVSVPESLKASLLEIPDREVAPLSARTESRAWWVIAGGMAAIAASALLMVYGFSKRKVADRPKVDPAAVALIVSDMQRNLESIDEILDSQTKSLSRRQRDLNTDPIFETKESIALALSMSWQASLDQGANIDSIRDELQQVVTNYPNTVGARQAQNLLQIQ